MTIRVPVPANERLEALLYALRRKGIRTSKNEVIAALLMRLPETPTQDLLDTLEAFRLRT
jgi:hypothetical protein